MNFDVIIVGGGLVGASLAAALKHSGLSLALVESQPMSIWRPEVSPQADSPHPNPEGTTSQSTKPASGQAAGDLLLGEGANELLRERKFDAWDSRIYAISPGSRGFLEQSGTWALLDANRIAAVEEMRIFGDTGAELDFSAYQMGVPELACILEGSALQHALWQVLQTQDNLTLLHPAQCKTLTVHDGQAELALQDGCCLNAKLIVGADGRDSWIRQQAGITGNPIDYQQHGVVANFACTSSHRGIAHQWFQADGILALLPLPDNQVSMVWSVSPERAVQLLALSPDELCAQVATAAKNTLGGLHLITPPANFPLRLLTLEHITAPRVALIGDAAHNMHPLAGQGVNTGFRDARQLADILLARGVQTDCGAAQLLRRYERKRKEDIYIMQATTYGLKHLFNNTNPLLRTLRNSGLAITNQITPLKKILMQHALN
ncbi:MAG: UbiH/UbiF family hydroxylase [Gallionella sp.]